MTKTIWIKATPLKVKKLPEKKPVHIFAHDGKGNFMVYTAHHEQGVWFIYDHFTDTYRPFRRQQYVTHYTNLLKFPNIIKKATNNE